MEGKNMPDGPKQPYEGRRLILFMDTDGLPGLAYSITERETGSKPYLSGAEILEAKTGNYGFRLSTAHQNQTRLAGANQEFGLHTAMSGFTLHRPRGEPAHFLVGGNGQQTDQILTNLFFGDGLAHTQRAWSYESDEDNSTARISALLQYVQGRVMRAELGIIRRLSDKAPDKRVWSIILEKGCAHAISTYSGINVPSDVRIPPFEGEPVQSRIESTELGDLLVEFEGTMGHEDFRVALAVAKFDPSLGKFDYRIKNHRR